MDSPLPSQVSWILSKLDMSLLEVLQKKAYSAQTPVDCVYDMLSGW